MLPSFLFSFEGEAIRDVDTVFKSWMNEISKQLFSAPIFLPVYSSAHGCELCQRLNPISDPAYAEPHLSFVGLVLALSVVRKIPIKHTLSVAVAKLLLGDSQLGLEDLQYELPDEFHRLSSLSSKSKQDLDHILAEQLNSDERSCDLTPKSRIFHLCQAIKKASPRSPRSHKRYANAPRFLGDQADVAGARADDALLESGDSETASAHYDGVYSDEAAAGRTFGSSNVNEYICHAVSKHFAKLKEQIKHIMPAFCQIVPETTRRNLTAVELINCWSGDVDLKVPQVISRYYNQFHFLPFAY
jgi:hypothetical protein